MEYIKTIDTEFQPPGSSQPVYKDDCMFSFDTAFDENGLDICLSCYQAFSRGGLDYTHQHSEFFDHKVFLNYKKVLKPIEERSHDQQPLKLMKLEIKEETESDLYDLKTSIYYAPENTSVEYPNSELPESIQKTAEAIIKATSSEKKEEIKAWEQEIIPCQHAFDIIQNPKDDLDLSKCGNCELKENLWICLNCGELGCGRAQFGGVPGNSDALLHYKNTGCQHHISVKLGSLSGDSADCYCYTCEDEVKVPELDKLLLTFGIDISNRIKTEKNLTELQLEQNIKWDFNMSGKNGEILKPVFGAGLTGFKNLGNSCYMASALQVLFSIPSFKDSFYIEEGMPVDKILNPEDPAKDLETQLFKVGDGLWSGRYSKPDLSTTEVVKFQKGIRPSGFKSLIGEGHQEFCTMQQQDAYEFWIYLLEKIEKSKATGVNDISPNNVFDYVMENKLKCTNCQKIRLTQNVSNSLTLPVHSKVLSVDEEGKKQYEEVTFNKCFTEGLGDEEIEYNCPQCGNKQVAIKSTAFKSYPDFLVVSPQRIVLENWVPAKLDAPIKFEELLNVSFTKASGQLPGEELLPEDGDGEEAAFEFNQAAMNDIIAMGFSENGAKRALYNTGNSSAEDATNWLFSHLEDPDLNESFNPPAAGSGGSATKTNAYKPEDIENLMSMGFGETIAHKALVLNKGNMEASVDWLFSHPDDDGVLVDEDEEDGKAGASETKAEMIERLVNTKGDVGNGYGLHAVICHKGTSIHSGHYVAFIKKEVNGELKWVLFNDEKVVLADELSLKDIETTGYLYIYKKL